jgi:outer membrane beta-barrel protein/carboxypeptidase family protein/TonB-dependent receptor-like protein
MRRLLALLAVVAIAVAAHAQEDVTVAGRVVAAGDALPFATVTIARDGNAVAGAIADDAGRFVVNGLPRGAYTVTSSFLGFEPTELPLLIGERNDHYDLGDIVLQRTAGEVDEVIVSAQRQILEANLDRRVFDLSQTFAQTTGSALDAMRGLPGITVNQDGTVQLRGSDRVLILVDGKQSSLTGFGNQSGLDSVPASSIASIEIINNPSAAYDAAGMAGVINIVYKKDQEVGRTLEVGLTGSVGQLSKRKPDLPTELGSFSSNPKLGPSVNLVNNGENGGFFVQADVLFQEDLPNNEFTTRYYDDGRIVYSQVPENREQTQVVVRSGVDRILDDDRSLTFSSLFDFEEHKDVAQVPYIDGATMEPYRLWFWTEKEKTGHLNLMLDYKREFEQPGRELSLSAQYTRGWEDEAYFLNDRSALRNSQDATHLDAVENTLPLALDYVRPTRSGRLETGAKLQRRWIPVDYVVERGVDSIIYPGLGDWSEWGEYIYAGYVNYVHEKPKYAVEAGLRVEQTEVYYDLPPENIYYSQSDQYDYFEPFPNVRLTYNVNDANRIAFHYSNRVDRPGEPELRIFPKYDDPEILKVGNPYLRPQFTESHEVSHEHLWDRGSLVASLYHRSIDDPFVRVFAIDDSNPDYDIVNRIYQNVGSGSHDGVELLFTHDLGERWRLSGSANWYESVIDAAETTLLFPVQRPFSVPRREDDTWDMKINSLLRLPNGIEAQLSFVYYAEKPIAQGREAARSSIDLGFKKPVLNARGELVVSVSDVFNEFGLRYTIDGEGFDAVYENFYETQVVSVGLSYTF